jgi:LL-diaminopimelate aminotransferase
MIKRVILDKADRLYHFPFDLEDFFPRRTIKTAEKRVPTIDLGHFRWPVEPQLPASGSDPFEIAGEHDLAALKETLADWLSKEFGFRPDPRKELYISQGIRRIVFEVFQAFIEYGDVVLCPEPGVPFYRRLAISVCGVPVAYPISAKSNYKTPFTKLASNLGKAAKILIINNPSNPFGTLLDETELAELLRLASKQNLFVINDAAYCSLAEEKYVPLRSVRGGEKVGLEIFSIPFTFGLPYSPFGFAVGPPEVINGLEIIGKTIGRVIPKPWIDPAIKAIEGFPSEDLKKLNKRIDRSRHEAMHLIDKINCRHIGGQSGPFIWVKLPEKKQSGTYAATLLRRRRILALPGTAFGTTGEGFIRLSLTAGPEEYKEALSRLSKRFTVRTKAGKGE